MEAAWETEIDPDSFETKENSASCVSGEGRRGVVFGRDHGLGRDGVPAEVGRPLKRGTAVETSCDAEAWTVLVEACSSSVRSAIESSVS